MPPKRTPSARATQVPASNFFQQVKKPATAAHARTITLKKNEHHASTPVNPISQQLVAAKDTDEHAKATKGTADKDNYEEEEVDEIDEAEYDDDFDETTDYSKVAVVQGKKQQQGSKSLVTVAQMNEEILDDSEDDLVTLRKDQPFLTSSDVEDDEEDDDDDEQEEGLFDEIKPAAAPAVKKVNKLNHQQQQQSSRQAKGARMHKDKPATVPDVGDIHKGFHQNELSALEKTLRQFDLAQKYGPCTDVTRLERWERAFALGLNPPRSIKDALLANPALDKALFNGRV
ncbi:DNA polymerase delta subunit 4 [Actinomortierella ambigua]|nr:DNA polymerase delta subunit 4 [Actinomortierella ambigua]